MKHILFVDDEAQVLGGLQGSLRKQRHQWDMAFATSGQAALAHLRKNHCDVVVSDMRMPGMDGASLLGQVKDEFPGVIRIVLSGHSEREAVMRALPTCHQFLAKPCDVGTLRSVIERACGLHALLESDALRRVVGSTEKLPSLPRVYWELTRTMARPDATPKEIAAVVEQDPAMCAKVLQLVNSSYFGLARRVCSVEPAIVYLGLELVRSLTLTAHVFSAAEKTPAIPGFSFDRLQEHGFLVAAVAKKMTVDLSRREEAFTAALLHDVGKVILACAVPAGFAQVLAQAKATSRPTHAIELETLGVSHAEVGAYLLGLWGLPVSIVEAVAYHHAPGLVPQSTSLDTLATVHVADALVGALGRGGAVNPDLDASYLQRIGVLDRVPEWTAIAAREWEMAQAKWTAKR